jgi:hypothetical protein
MWEAFCTVLMARLDPGWASGLTYWVCDNHLFVLKQLVDHCSGSERPCVCSIVCSIDFSLCGKAHGLVWQPADGLLMPTAIVVWVGTGSLLVLLAVGCVEKWGGRGTRGGFL